ncbi:MAG: hypothetical protein ACFFDN_02555 [Candidatus Hodarchaeota archaeon]
MSSGGAILIDSIGIIILSMVCLIVAVKNGLEYRENKNTHDRNEMHCFNLKCIEFSIIFVFSAYIFNISGMMTSYSILISLAVQFALIFDAASAFKVRMPIRYGLLVVFIFLVLLGFFFQIFSDPFTNTIIIVILLAANAVLAIACWGLHKDYRRLGMAIGLAFIMLGELLVTLNLLGFFFIMSAIVWTITYFTPIAPHEKLKKKSSKYILLTSILIVTIITIFASWWVFQAHLSTGANKYYHGNLLFQGLIIIGVTISFSIGGTFIFNYKSEFVQDHQKSLFLIFIILLISIMLIPNIIIQNRSKTNHSITFTSNGEFIYAFHSQSLNYPSIVASPTKLGGIFECELSEDGNTTVATTILTDRFGEALYYSTDTHEWDFAPSLCVKAGIGLTLELGSHESHHLLHGVSEDHSMLLSLTFTPMPGTTYSIINFADPELSIKIETGDFTFDLLCNEHLESSIKITF